MTRYFMTIPEAVQLVIRAGDIGAGKGEVFVLDMGEPVKIVDLAHNMIRLAGYEPETDIAVEFTQPRPGEKLHEELFGEGETSQPTAARRIHRAVRKAPLRPRLGRVDPQLARAHGAGRRRGESRRAGGLDHHGSGRRRGDGRLRRVASRRNLLEVIKDIGAFAGLAAFFGVAVLALLSFTQGRDIRRLREWAGSSPERDAERKESTSAVAAERAEEMRRLEEARDEERGTAELRESRRERREAGLPELTRSERISATFAGGRSRLSEPLVLVAVFLVVVAVGGGIAYAAIHGFGGGEDKAGGKGAKQSKSLTAEPDRGRRPQRHRGRRAGRELRQHGREAGLQARRGHQHEHGDRRKRRHVQVGQRALRPSRGRRSEDLQGEADDGRNRTGGGGGTGRGRDRRGQCLVIRIARLDAMRRASVGAVVFALLVS